MYFVKLNWDMWRVPHQNLKQMEMPPIFQQRFMTLRMTIVHWCSGLSQHNEELGSWFVSAVCGYSTWANTGFSGRRKEIITLVALVNTTDLQGRLRLGDSPGLLLLLFLYFFFFLLKPLCFRTLLVHLKGERYNSLQVNCHTGRRRQWLLSLCT